MYEVQINGTDLYYPSNKEYAIFNTDLQLDVGLAGEFTFDVPLGNPIYDTVGQGFIVTILRDGKEYWRGEIKEVKTALNKTKTVYCLEDLSWLSDEFLPPISITEETYSQRFAAAIDAYNESRPADRQFVIGYLTNVSASDKCTWNTEYEWSILDSLRNCICKDSGYIKIRRVTVGNTVTRYIDIVKLSDYGVQATQPIVFGVNLLDYLQKMDLGNLTNVLIPYGAELEDAEEIYSEHAQRLAGTPIKDDVSIAKYGRHAKSVVFDGVTSLNALNGLAQAYLTRYSNPQLSMEIKAIDLAEISNNNHFDIGDSIHIIADVFNIDQWIYLTKQTLDLQDASKNEITLSSSVRRSPSVSAQTAETADVVKNMPSKASLLDSAKRNALNMLLDETQGGHIVYEYHETDGRADYIEAINICNQPTIDASTKRWRWSQSGLGYMERQDTSSAWSTLKLALTDDGAIVAETIGAGTISGCNFYWTGEYIDPQTQETRTATGHLYFDNPLGDIPTVNLESTAHLDLEAAFSLLLKARDGISIATTRGGVSLNAGPNGVCSSEGYRIAGTMNDQKLEFWYGESGGYKFLYVYIDGDPKGYVQLS